MRQKHTRPLFLVAVLGLGLVIAGLSRAAPAAGQDDGDARIKIASAMSAGPTAIARDATILDGMLDDTGNFVVLREGTNGWTCLPDAPGTPHLDPMCLDQTWLGWLHAIVAHKAPDKRSLGLAYMLQGGSDASNTDPFATEPAAGDQWIASSPHVMLLQPDPLDQSVFSTDPDAGGPWIMWAGTPYEHIMMPVAEGAGVSATPAP